MHALVQAQSLAKAMPEVPLLRPRGDDAHRQRPLQAYLRYWFTALQVAQRRI